MNKDIISPENLVYEKPRLMNDTAMHYCAGCSHGVVHKLVAEVIAEMGMEDKAIGVSPVGRKLHTVGPLPWLQASSVYGPTVSYSPIRAMATWPVSEQQKPSIR